MRIVALSDAEPRARRAALGTFDGVHLGHRRVIAGSDAVVTFEPHPARVIAPAAAPPLLTTLERKAELVAGLGVQELVVVPFDERFASSSPQAFVDEVLVERLGVRRVAVGENFRFGHRAAGDAALLAADGRFETQITPLLEVDGEIVSSSHIRGLLLGGAVEYANTLLGAPFTMSGEVVHGEKRGRTLGFPTANLIPPEGYVVPGHGVYAALADGMPAAVSIGVRPQFQTGLGELIEAFVIDWEGDLYGRTLKLELLKRLRGERRFPAVEDLLEQMRRDVDEARAVCAAASPAA
ncbi:MAG TPA: bifunctional riboflavin kinase/FAD synthetase [Solirubrobacteraceae bacterium]|nr:bifunctional riboflavin kinase/FAD synthetase [Solirubrobacteraceae bacterium]